VDGPRAVLVPKNTPVDSAASIRARNRAIFFFGVSLCPPLGQAAASTTTASAASPAIASIVVFLSPVAKEAERATAEG
jgi:hypothetical protein